MVPIEFLPLSPKDTLGKLVLTSNDLGTYNYDLKLSANPAPPERSIHFKVGLGSSQTHVFRFVSYSKVKTDYNCKVDSPDFVVEKVVSVGPGEFSSIILQLMPCLTFYISI